MPYAILTTYHGPTDRRGSRYGSIIIDGVKFK